MIMNLIEVVYFAHVVGTVEVNVTFHSVETSISMKFQKRENVTATYEKFWNFQKPLQLQQIWSGITCLV